MSRGIEEGEPADLGCPALLVAAPASGQGKTLVTAALVRRHRALGRRVRVFKAGPDFLDPMVLEVASGLPVDNLDLRLLGVEGCARRLAEAATDADLIVVEGVMGLHDGTPSSAELAAMFGLPVLLVIDAAAMAQTFGALALGLASYRRDIVVHGVLANRVSSAGHASMLRDALSADLRWIGHLPACAEAALPERHLGLVQAREIAGLDRRIDAAAEALCVDTALPPQISVKMPARATPRASLRGKRIAVARDEAFSFIYPANVEQLRELGSDVCFFSPISDARLPDCDALWLPGGYPELHLDALEANHGMREAINAHHGEGHPILAECGGMLYLCTSLRDVGGHTASMAGLLPGGAALCPRLTALGQQSVTFPAGELRGHTFHYSTLDTAVQPWRRASTANGAEGEAVYRIGALTASYVHFYFPSNPQAAAGLFTK